MRFRAEQGFSYERHVEGSDPLLLAHPDAHETAATILDRIAGRAERTGDLALATAARALTLTLPLEDDSRDYRIREHARLLARLN
jgi:hypothetical protein